MDNQTAQPEPNQVLTAESNHLFRVGDLITHDDFGPCLFTRDPFAKFDRYRFIGRPDAEGWIPWSGGENPVPGQMVRVRMKGYEYPDFSPSEEWNWSTPHLPIIAFRLSPQKDGKGGLGETSDLRSCVPTAQADEPPGQLQAAAVLARLISEVESFDRAPDNARVWIGGWSTYSGVRDPSLVHAGEVRSALSHPVAAEGEVAGLGSFSQEAKIPTAHASDVTSLIQALENAREFIDRYSDVNDGIDGVPEPNRAMSLVSEIDAALGKSL